MRRAIGSAAIRLSLVTLALFLFAPSVLIAAAPTVQAVTTDIEDKRDTDQNFAGLTVKVKLVGDVMAEARGVRATIKSAVDNTGRSLVKGPDPNDSSTFNEINDDSPEITLELASPARAAATVQKITGMVEIFVPKRDPAARIIVPHILAHTGRPLTIAGLQAAEMQVVVLTNKQYAAYKKQDAAEKASPKSGKSGIGEELAAGLKDAFSKMLGLSDTLGPNDMALTIADPKSRLISVEFEKADGEKIDANSQMTNGSSETFSFDKPLPAAAKLRFYVLTPASLIKMLLTLTDVPLP